MKNFQNALREVACQLTETDYILVTSHWFPLLRIWAKRPEVIVHKYHLPGDTVTLKLPDRLP